MEQSCPRFHCRYDKNSLKCLIIFGRFNQRKFSKPKKINWRLNRNRATAQLKKE